MKTTVALGFFDGVHLAHQKIIRTAVEQAGGLRAVALTFDRAPAEVLFASPVSYLTNKVERERLIASLGAECVSLSTTPELLKMSGEAFVKEILIEKMEASALVCGYNYSFGSDLLGAGELKKIGEGLGLSVTVLPEESSDGEPISSSRIRALLEKGEAQAASALLGRPYSITKVVEQGKHLGRAMGFPTINLYPEPWRVKMARGVYATWVEFDGEKHKGVTNIGINPTVGDKNMRVETHLPHFSGDLYGKEVTVYFMRFLRPERKFASIDELFSQIAADTAMAEQILC